MKYTTPEAHARALATQRLPLYLKEALKTANRKGVLAIHSDFRGTISLRAQTALDRIEREVKKIEQGRRPRRSAKLE